ncbi:MAG: DUF1684 domain-containing protein [Gorillibacterium sp.]|nr:DUF1684 domain-containing protein [Gorillibacterium sp.]
MTTIEAWRVSRQQSVAGFQGDLTLIGLHTILQPMRIEGIPGSWAPLVSGEPGLMLTAAASDLITVDGRVVDGTVTLEVDRSIVRFSETLTAAATSQPGSIHLLAVWATDSEAVQRYEGISTFIYDPEWVIPAEFITSDDQRKIAFAHKYDHAGSLRYHQSPGDIRFTKAGVSYLLRPFDSADSLIVVFGDATNGKESYGMGRMLIVAPDASGYVALDFNRCFLPPCAFSAHFNCPLPPAQNRLPFEVNAGEKQVRYRI